MGEKDKYKSRSVVPATQDFGRGPDYAEAIRKAREPWKPLDPDKCFVCGKYLQKVTVRKDHVLRGDEWVEYGCQCGGRIVLMRFKEAPEPPKPADVRGKVAVEVKRADGAKCPRCWNYHTVRGNPLECCDRCVLAVNEMLPGLVAEGKWSAEDAEEWRGLVRSSVSRWKV